MRKMKISHQQMNLILMAVEHGVRQCEKGNNLQAALASVFDLYEVEHPDIPVLEPITAKVRELNPDAWR